MWCRSSGRCGGRAWRREKKQLWGGSGWGGRERVVSGGVKGRDMGGIWGGEGRIADSRDIVEAAEECPCGAVPAVGAEEGRGVGKKSNFGGVQVGEGGRGWLVGG